MRLEEWRGIPEFDDYQASSFGNIRSLDKIVRCGGRAAGSFRLRRGRVLRPHTPKGRYPQVRLYEGGRGVVLMVHKLVALTFMGPRSDDLQVCHNDGNKMNNGVDNLRYDTLAANQADRLRHGTDMLGEKSSNAKITASIVIDMRQRFDAGERISALADKFGISWSQASRVCRHESWSHL